MHYVYIHKHRLTSEVLYYEKGSNHRYKDHNSRQEEHLQLTKK